MSPWHTAFPIEGAVIAGRDVDPRRTRKAIRQVKRLRAVLEERPDAELSAWERTFLQEVDQRLETYGSAFADWAKGDRGEALSRLQNGKLKEIAGKAKPKGALGRKRPMKQKGRMSGVNDDGDGG